MQLTIYSFAKVNLFLHIHSKLPNGYHYLESLACFTDISDILKIEKSYDYSLTYDGVFKEQLPKVQDNILTKIYYYFKHNFILDSDLKVTLEKNIPVASGIGGGSSNGASLILAINNIFNLGLELKDLDAIAKKFGSDVPLCLRRKSSFFYGQGFNFKDVLIPKDLFIILINPKISISTEESFNLFAKNPLYVESLKNDNFDYKNSQQFVDFLKSTSNSLEKSSIELVPVIFDILKTIEEQGFFGRMSGSGSTCFALCLSQKDQQLLYDKLLQKYPEYWITKGVIF